MASKNVFVFLLLMLQLVGQVFCKPPEWVCQLFVQGICVQEQNMDQSHIFEDVSLGEVVYTLNATTSDDHVIYEIVETADEDISPGTVDGIDYVTVNKITGEVTFFKSIDYEVYDEMRPTWRITSSDSGDYNEKFVRVYIDNVNDITPRFLNEPYISDPIPENTAIGSVVFSNVNAIDDDSDSPPVDGPIVYSLLLDYDDKVACESNVFAIDSDSGKVSLMDKLDYLGQIQYTICIQANDQGTQREPLTKSTTVRLSVSDVQGEPPKFVGIPYQVSVPEDTPVNTLILDKIVANDGDTGVLDQNHVNITLESGGDGLFRLETPIYNKAELYVNKKLNREEKDTYTLNIMAREDDDTQQDENIVTTTTIDVTVLDVNDEIPEFSQSDESVVELQENSPRQTPLNLGIIVEDKDTPPFAKFMLSLEGEEGAFELYQTNITSIGTVDIRVKDRELLNYETQDMFQFKVVAYEAGLAKATLNVTVKLLDINDNSPKFQNETYKCFVLENSDRGTGVCQVVATDADSEIYANVTYSLEGSGNDKFHIDTTTGDVTVVSKELDAEQQALYFLTVIASDSERIDTALLEIELQDVNDEPPVFNLGPTERQITIDEFDNLTLVTEPLVTVTASDRDVEPENRERTYSIGNGNDAGKFYINSTSGEIWLIDTIDYDGLNEKEYKLLVLANNTVEPYLSGSAEVTVTISDINDNAPIFENATYRVYVPEDASDMIEVITLTATDADKPENPNSRIDYRITSGSQDQFRIEVSTGKILVNAKLDRESTETYSLEVVAADRGIKQLTGICTVLVTVTDVNDEEPVFNDIDPPFIQENHATGPSAVFCNASAEDHDLIPDLIYIIDTDNIVVEDENGDKLPNTLFANQFGIVETTGGLYVNESLDREAAAVFNLPLVVRDNNAPEDDDTQIDTTQITITIEDINDNTPEFQYLPYVFEVEENEAEGTVISADISATDPDLGPNGQVTYTKQNGSGFEFVDINPQTGILTVVRSDIDREEYAVLEVIIRASDMGKPPNYANTIITLNIRDVNDNPPVFNETIQQPVEILEDVEIGWTVLTVTASDVDTDHANIIYAITAGNIEGKFAISPGNGVISTKARLDRENTTNYILTITASDKPDGGGNSDDIVVKVEILDVNDMIPRITSSEFGGIVKVLENVDVGTSILFVDAEDGDQALTPNSKITFYIGGGNSTASENPDLEDGDLFDIEVDSGEIVTITSLQALSNIYTLIVVVRDQGVPPLESNRTLIVDVLDSNDDIPTITFPSQNDKIYVKENFGPSAYVLTIDAYDNDQGLNGKINYEFDIRPDGSEDYKKFILYNSTGKLCIKEMTDRETQAEYILNIKAANRESEEQRESETVSFTVVVNDTNDNEPIFREPGEAPEPQHLEVGENLESAVVGNVDLAVDKDGPGNNDVFYFIVGGNDGNWFILDKYSGNLTLQTQLDREAKSNYTIIVKATSDENYDGNLNKLDNFASNQLLDPEMDTNLLEVVIQVTDDNDSPPVFTKELFTAGVKQTQNAFENIVQVTATDADIDPNKKQMEYSLEDERNCVEECGPVLKKTFQVDAQGWIQTLRTFENSERGWYEIDVMVYDPTTNNTEFVNTARVDIYLITVKEQIRIDFSVDTSTVRGFQEEFLDLYATIIEEDDAFTNVAINVDDLQVYTDDTVTPPITIDNWTYMVAHAVDLDTNRVINAEIVERSIDEAYNYAELIKTKYSVLEVFLLYTEPEVLNFTWIQWTCLGFAIGFLFLLVVTLIAFVFTRNDYKRKLRAANAGLFTSNTSPVQKTVVPGTNMYSQEASNPVFNEKDPSYQEINNESTEEGESANSMNDSEEQEFTVNMYDDENDQQKTTMDTAINSNKLLLAVLDELENNKTEKFGIDNIDVTDV